MGACSAGISCDPSKILCKRVAPQCPAGQVPSVSGSCYGPCVAVMYCTCSPADATACPSTATGQAALCNAVTQRCALTGV